MTSYIYDMVDTWNAGATTFTSIKMNVTDTASAAGSLLMDLQVGGTSYFSVVKSGRLKLTGQTFQELETANTLSFYFSGSNQSRFTITANGAITRDVGAFAWTNGQSNGTQDLFLTRRAAANLRLGAADAAAPVAQTLSVQSVVAGTSNTAGANLTITGSQGTGTGAGGSIVFQVAPAGSSGTAQNALATALTIDSTRLATFVNGINVTGGTTGDIITGNSSRVALGSTAGPVVYLSRPTIGDFYFWADHGSAGGSITSPGGFSFSSSGTTRTVDLILFRDAANTLALRNGANAQVLRVYNTTDGTNSEYGKIAWSSNVLQIGTEKTGTGTARALAFQTDGTTRLTIATNGDATFSGGIRFNAQLLDGNGKLLISGSALYDDNSFTAVRLGNASFNRLQFGGTSSSFPALKRDSTTLQARLADDSAFASVQGKLTTDTAYAAGDPTTTGYLVVYDSTGTAYKIPAVAV